MDNAVAIAVKAQEMAQQAHARLDVIERMMEERARTADARHAETRQLIIDLKGSFRENFEALQSHIAEAVDQFRKVLDDHKVEDDRRFGIISSRSWSAMWALNAVLLTVLLGLAGAVWKMSGH